MPITPNSCLTVGFFDSFCSFFSLFLFIQRHLFLSVLPNIFSLACRSNIRTLSLPLIFDNILLSMWTISGSYVGFGWKNSNPTFTHTDVSNFTSNSSNRSNDHRTEEMAVYECMVRYIESHMRSIKYCLTQLPPNCSLKNIVFYLPSSSSIHTTTLTDHIHMPPPMGAFETSVGSISASPFSPSTTSPSSSSSSSSSSGHPFLPKCQTLFREIFQ